jgi:hypothetical protein
MVNSLSASSTYDSSYDFLTDSHLGQEKNSRRKGKLGGVRILYSGPVSLTSYLVFSR